MEEEKSLKDEVREMREAFEAAARKKTKKFNLPMKARISRGRLNKGYITVAIINENRNIDFKREPIIDGTIKLDDTFHAVTDLDDMLFYKGKPFIFQPKDKINPYNPLKENHETYGQKYVMARMEGDKITTKKKIGWGLTIGGLIIGGVIAYALLTGA